MVSLNIDLIEVRHETLSDNSLVWRVTDGLNVSIDCIDQKSAELLWDQLKKYAI